MTVKTSHEERTAPIDPQPDTHRVFLKNMEQVSRTVRVVRLQPLGKIPKARDLIHSSDR